MLQPSKLVMFHKPSGRWMTWIFPFGIPLRRITLYINMSLFLGYPGSVVKHSILGFVRFLPRNGCCVGRFSQKIPEPTIEEEYFAGLLTSPLPRMHQLKTRCILGGPDSNQSFPLPSILLIKCFGICTKYSPFHGREKC